MEVIGATRRVQHAAGPFPICGSESQKCSRRKWASLLIGPVDADGDALEPLRRRTVCRSPEVEKYFRDVGPERYRSRTRVDICDAETLRSAGLVLHRHRAQSQSGADDGGPSRLPPSDRGQDRGPVDREGSVVPRQPSWDQVGFHRGRDGGGEPGLPGNCYHALKNSS